MAGAFVLESADGSPRWYLTPGAESSCDIAVTSNAESVVFCSVHLDEPGDGGSFEPASFSLIPHETKTVRLIFKAATQVPRSERAVVTLRDDAGNELARLERQVVDGGGTDCVVSLDLRKALLDDGELKGFTLACAIKSRSAVPGRFGISFAPHPALGFESVQPVQLGPGESATIIVPVLWDRAARDANGLNHPSIIECNVAVTHGRRNARLPWTTIHRGLGRYLSDAERQISGETLPTISPPPPKTEPRGVLETLTTVLTAPIHSPIRTPQTLSGEMPGWVAEQPTRASGSPSATRTEGDAQRRGINALLIMIAALALIVAAFFLFRPGTLGPPLSAPVASMPPLPAGQSGVPRRPSGASRAPSAARKAIPKGTAAARGATALAAPAPVATIARPTPAAAVFPTSGVAAFQSLDAKYGPRGRSVRVSWLATGQRSALVQLTDRRSRVIASARLRGSQQTVALALPRGFRDTVFAQVTLIGRLGERVVQTTSLPPF